MTPSDLPLSAEDAVPSHRGAPAKAVLVGEGCGRQKGCMLLLCLSVSSGS